MYDVVIATFKVSETRRWINRFFYPIFLPLAFYAILGTIWCAALLLVLVLKSIVSTIKDLLTMEPFSRQTGIHMNPTTKAIEAA